MLRRFLGLLLTSLLTTFALLATGLPASAATAVVTNGTQFTDSSGAVVHAHGGGVLKVGSYYYWFGENRNPDKTFKAVSVYRSTDLKTWDFRGNALSQASAPELAVANIERPKVIYNSATGKFVMWMHKENGKDYTEARSAVAISDTVDGAYTWQGSFRPPSGTTSRDMTLFKDDDGTAYQVTSANSNADLQIYKLNADYTGYDRLVANPWVYGYREAPALFKRDGIYFMLTSGNSGWGPNQQKYATAESLAGPWSGMKDVGNQNGYRSQTTFVLPVQGTSETSYLYMGDRWAPATGGTVNDSQYVWLPLTFPTRTTMVLPWYPQIGIDVTAGTITGVGGGPYYNFVARHSAKCLEVPDSSASDNSMVVQFGCDTDLNQQWRLEDAGGGYVRVIAQHSGKCLEVEGASVEDRAFVNQNSCVATAAKQQWRIEDQGGGYNRLVARHSGKCLDVQAASTANSARLIQWTCGTGTNQQFRQNAV